MDYLFPTIFASILLIPVLYVLQTGLTKLGILAVSLLSFVFIMLVVGLNGVVPLWQDGLVVLLLALVITYTLQTRLYRYFFVTEQEEIPKQTGKTPQTDSGPVEETVQEEKQENEELAVETKTKQLEKSYFDELFQRNQNEKKEGTKL
ncbi:hypothetical protein [Ectobacillus polymachus]|uniref:hypothetical protein n=1 Tax=Ectobacillus polymachus TaxID=1508806 RepID=UPI003A8963F3